MCGLWKLLGNRLDSLTFQLISEQEDLLSLERPFFGTVNTEWLFDSLDSHLGFLSRPSDSTLESPTVAIPACRRRFYDFSTLLQTATFNVATLRPVLFSGAPFFCQMQYSDISDTAGLAVHVGKPLHSAADMHAHAT